MMAEKLLAKDPNLYDAWIAVGVENYMLSIKQGAGALSPAAGGRANGSGDRDRKTEARCREGPLPGAFRAVDAGRGGVARQSWAGSIHTDPVYRQELARLSPAIAVNNIAQ